MSPSPSADSLPLSRLAAVQQAMAAARALRITPNGEGPTLMAVSKGRSATEIEALIAAGVRRFGENRVQEIEAKWPAIKGRYPQVTLHLIGPLQTNKVRTALRWCEVIETLDRPALADALAEESARSGKRPELYIQVNTGEEPQKAGVAPAGLGALMEYARARDFYITGLMCIPPADRPPAPHFAFLRRLAERHGLPNLSMGMSSDFAEAIRMGATQIRIGTALFGER